MSMFLSTNQLARSLREHYHKGNVQATVLLLLNKIEIGPYRVMLKTNFNTACWIPPTGSRGSHSIYYGDQMLSRVIEFFIKNKGISIASVSDYAAKLDAKSETRIADAIEAQLVALKKLVSTSDWLGLIENCTKAVAAYGRHERAHASETPRDLKKVNANLRSRGIPFDIFNWFEDARIEHISRIKLAGKPFDWLSFEEMAPLEAHPLALFARRIQLEGAVDVDAVGHPMAPLSKMASRIAYYYETAITYKSGELLYPLMKEFMVEFAEYLIKPPNLAGTHFDDSGSSADGPAEAGDLSIAAEAADKGDEFFNEFESDAIVVGGTDEEGKKAEAEAKDGKGRGPNKEPVIAGSVKPTAVGGRAPEGKLLSATPGVIDAAFKARLDTLVGMLMKMFKSNTLAIANESPGNRISSRHLARGEIRYIHKKVFGGKGKRRYEILFDCSGSMSGFPSREGKLLLLALNTIAKRGYLEGNLILTGWNGKAHCWAKYPFPVQDEIILRITTSCGAEGIQGTMLDNLSDLKRADDVYIYTDANITDTPLDRGLFALHNIQPVGLYVGPEDCASSMKDHFPQNIIDSSIERVVDRMLCRNKR